MIMRGSSLMAIRRLLKASVTTDEDDDEDGYDKMSVEDLQSGDRQPVLKLKDWR